MIVNHRCKESLKDEASIRFEELKVWDYKNHRMISKGNVWKYCKADEYDNEIKPSLKLCGIIKYCPYCGKLLRSD